MVTRGQKKLCVGFTLMVLLALGTAVAAADAPSKGLGATWPNAQDVSRSSNWHVYVFARDGVKYIQVNDAVGNVRGGVAASGDGLSAIALPLGTAEVSVATSTPADGTVIYDDGATAITQSSSQGLSATPSAAATTFRAADCTSVADCSKLNN